MTVQMQAFVMDRVGVPYYGKVWPGPVHFPDFGSDNGTQLWATLLSRFHKKLGFHGLWTDMNEPSNFVPGALCPQLAYSQPARPASLTLAPGSGPRCCRAFTTSWASTASGPT